MFGMHCLGMLPPTENLHDLRPQSLTDNELDSDPSLRDVISPWHGDDVSYIPGLNNLLDLFLLWHYAQMDGLYKTPGETLKDSLYRAQKVIDDLPPELRWRGGLSRPLNATLGHDVQIANIFVTSLHLRSNFLQRFGNPSHAEHQSIVSDLVEVLYHLPQLTIEANGYSMIPKIRDIGAAYLDKLQIGPGGIVDAVAKEKLARLLAKLEEIDLMPRFPIVTPAQRDGSEPDIGVVR